MVAKGTEGVFAFQTAAQDSQPTISRVHRKRRTATSRESERESESGQASERDGAGQRGRGMSE